MNSLSATCVDPNTQECLLLETYALSAQTPSGRINALDQLYSNNLTLGDAWASVTVCAVSENFTLIPERLAHKDSIANYLTFASPKNNGSHKYFTHTDLGVSVAFSIDPILLRWLEQTYQHVPIRMMHQASSLIALGIHHVSSTSSHDKAKLFVFLSPTHVHISMYHEGNLGCYNQFRYESSDDFLSAVLTVITTLGLDPKYNEVILSGHIYPKSLAYKKVENYLGKVAIYERPNYLKFGKALQQSAIQENADLFGALIC